MCKNQKGFGAAVVLLTLIIVALIGFAGWYVWHNRTNKQTTAEATTQQTSTTPPQGLTESSASKTATDFYEKYDKLNPPGSPSVQEAFLKQYGTDNLLTYFKNNQNGVDPIVCAQSLPESFKVTSSTVSQKTATVTIEEMFGSEKVSVTATVVDQNGLKIDALKCAKPLPATRSEGP